MTGSEKESRDARNVLIIEMHSGISGDMLLAGLLALSGDADALEKELSQLGFGPVSLAMSQVPRKGLTAAQVRVLLDGSARAETRDHGHHHHHAHHSYRRIRDTIASAPFSDRVKEQAQRVYRVLAEAEAAVHQTEIEGLHFHEVGRPDSVVNIVGCCLLLERLGIANVTSTPVLTGCGTVTCAHGVIEVPVPAVRAMLEQTGVPSERVSFETGEITTPTGCALICALADSFDCHCNLSVERTAFATGHRVIPGLRNVMKVCIGIE